MHTVAIVTSFIPIFSQVTDVPYHEVEAFRVNDNKRTSCCCTGGRISHA